ncbi:MAG: GH92 family glycosyl hydrolase [Chthoniobacter sp.]|nr:GH92 family glycosyl hydrolase [Chthoniobacter sp.]
MKQGAAQARKSTAAGPLADLVNPLQGTNSTKLFSRGNTLAIVAVPFGMAHWALQSSEAGSWYFQSNDQRLQGVRCTHQLSPWLGDYGHATFMPYQGLSWPAPAQRASSYRVRELKIKPYMLDVLLLRSRCRFELAPTERGAVLRFTYAKSGAAGVFIDLAGEDAEAAFDAAAGEIVAQVYANEGGVQKGFATYYTITSSAKIAGFELKTLKGSRVAIVRFEVEAGKPVELRVATSFISPEQAVLNRTAELEGKSFDAVKAEALEAWEKMLGRIRIEGASETERRIFYSCLYRGLLFPRMWHERDASGKLVHRSAFNGKVEPGVMYADHGYWDVYRAWYPMMALVYPDRLGEILQSWVNAYKEGGWLPQFPCPGYKNCMTGSPLDFVFGDAVARGIKGFDVEAAFEGLKKHATTAVAPGLGYGRPAVEEYEKLGYIPSDKVLGGLAETLDSAYGDFCIAQVARAAGKPEDAAFFLKRSQNWHKSFDEKTRFFRGRNADGKWVEPFDEFEWGGPYVEGGAWQYRFFLPFDTDGLIKAMGGRTTFVEALDRLVEQPPEFHIGHYGREIHEMSEMAAVDFGQYAHSNQPSHHALYMYSVAGRRDKTQHWVHRVLRELYTVDDFCGDEDTGSMGAWYVLSAMGIYGLCPGKPEWVLGAPLFRKAEIHRPDGATIRIEAQSSKPDAFLSRVTLNGAEVKNNAVTHEALVKGGRLVFAG